MPFQTDKMVLPRFRCDFSQISVDTCSETSNLGPPAYTDAQNFPGVTKKIKDFRRKCLFRHSCSNRPKTAKFWDFSDFPELGGFWAKYCRNVKIVISGEFFSLFLEHTGCPEYPSKLVDRDSTSLSLPLCRPEFIKNQCRIPVKMSE